MSRKWTARQATTFVEDNIEPSDFRAAFPLYRAGPELADARKQVLRLLAAYALVLLPLQVGVYFLAARSAGLAATVTLVLAAALAAVAIAKWLGLEDLLQKLPLLILLVLVGAGLLYLAGESSRKWDTVGFEFFGTLFIVVVVVSVLGNLYQPLSAAYQTLTLKTPARDLAIAATGLLVSLGLAVVSHALNPPLALTTACALSGGYAALVVAEYVAWVRANPARSLDQSEGPERGRDGHGSGVLFCGLVTGFSYGLLVFLIALPPQGPPWTDPRSFLGMTLDGLTVMRLWCVVFFCLGLLGTNAALGSLRWPRNSVLCWRLAADALVVFLTYPNTSHPLAHRISTPWLRPMAVRLVITGLVLSAATNSLLVLTKKRAASPASPRVAAGGSSVGSIPFTPRSPAADDLSPYARWHTRPENDPPVSTAPVNPPRPVAPNSISPESSASPEAFVARAAILILFPPALVYGLVFTLGVIALPHYYRRYEALTSSGPGK